MAVCDSKKATVDIVTACRALTSRGCSDGIGGHVSIRVPGRDAFWINAFDREFSEITPDDIIMSDHHGNVIEGNREVSLGSEFHGGIYGQRSDVNAIVHTHGFWGTALASLARPLKMRHNLCCLFHGDQVMSPDDSFESIGPRTGFCFDDHHSVARLHHRGSQHRSGGGAARHARRDGAARRHS